MLQHLPLAATPGRHVSGHAKWHAKWQPAYRWEDSAGLPLHLQLLQLFSLLPLELQPVETNTVSIPLASSEGHQRTWRAEWTEAANKNKLEVKLQGRQRVWCWTVRTGAASWWQTDRWTDGTVRQEVDDYLRKTGPFWVKRLPTGQGHS